MKKKTTSQLFTFGVCSSQILIQHSLNKGIVVQLTAYMIFPLILFLSILFMRDSLKCWTACIPVALSDMQHLAVTGKLRSGLNTALCSVEADLLYYINSGAFPAFTAER